MRAIDRPTKKRLLLIQRLRAQIKQLKIDLESHEGSWQLRWKADMRAVQKWQKATGKKNIWPDHADLCVWLMEQLDKARLWN